MKKRSLVLCTVSLLWLTACGNGADDAAPDPAGPNQAAADGGATAQPRSAEPARRAYDGPDIAGIHIGMSPAEAEVRLKAYDPNIRLQTSSRSFKYQALGARYETEPFIVAMVGQLPGGSGSIEVGFSWPPQPPRVVSVYRIHRQQQAPLSQADYMAALVEKYGEPASDSGNGQAGTQVVRTLEWSLPGGSTPCLAEGAGASAGNPVLTRMVQDGRRMASPDPAFAQNCAAIMRYTLSGEPVTQANGSLFDVAAAAKAEFEAQAWVDGLIQEKSRTGTEKPKL